MKKNLFICIFLITSLINTYSQLVTGKVIDQQTKEPLIGVMIKIENSSIGAITDINGLYSNLVLTQLGSGETYFSGYTDKLSIIQNGSGKVEALDLEAVNSNITLTGSGLIYCYVTELLNVDIKGSGRVYYKGSPQIQQTVEGEGLVAAY